MSRAERRHELNKKKRKALSFGDSYKKLYNHLASCSCWMCGNPRKWNNELTAKERLNADCRRLEEDWRALT